jgi:hypothetical protein
MSYFKQIFKQLLNEEKDIVIPDDKWFDSLQVNKFSKPFDFGKYLPVYTIITKNNDKFIWYITKEHVVNDEDENNVTIKKYLHKGNAYASFKESLKELKQFITNRINKINKE